MAKKLYVGNIAFAVHEDTLRDLFEEVGEVLSVKLITDRETGRFRGFGFVEMEDADAQKAIEKFDGYDFEGRPLKVSEARDRKPGGGSGRRPRPPRSRDR